MGCSVNFLQFILAVFLKGSVELTSIPSTAITYLEGTINFTCHKSDPFMAISWETELVQNHHFVANNESTTVLSVTINSSNVSFNNSDVRCIGLFTDNPAVRYCSNLVQIKLQGILSEVDAKMILSTCVVKVYWDPPFTLEGVPILGYNVNITNLDTNTTVSNITQVTSYNITLSYYDYEVSIAGVNGAGEGNKTYRNIKLQNQTISVVGDVTMSRNNHTWKIDATVIEKYVCLDNNSSFSFHICNESECLEALCTRTGDSNTRKLIANLYLTDNQHYYLTIISTIGKHNLSSKREVISTFDIQSVRVWPNSSHFCVTLYYARGSVANGALKIECDPDISLSYYVCGRSTGSKNSKSFCQTEFNFTGKRKCTLKVYDEVNGIIQNTTEPAIKMNVELTGTAKDAAGTDKFWTTEMIIWFTIGIVVNLALIVGALVASSIFQKECVSKFKKAK